MKEFLLEGRIFLDILLALVLGFLVGVERKIRSKEAGIRTHTIVCVGSALMTAISVNIGTGDPGRIAAQIVSGVGFLGAGIIVYKRHEVRGLTTAAGVWATAGVGMACGARLYYVAIGAALLLFVAQIVLHSRIFRSKKQYSVKIEFVQKEDENLKIKALFGIDRFNHLVINRTETEVTYSATLNTEKEFSSTKLNQIMAENDYIRSIERCEND